MAGTKAGGLKAVQTIKQKHGENFWKEIGAKGGAAKFPRKGFAKDDRTWFDRLLRKPRLASRAGQIGGRISRRTKVIE